MPIPSEQIGMRAALVLDVASMVANTFDRRFKVEAADNSWSTDITSIRTSEGFAYLAVVIDFTTAALFYSLQVRLLCNAGTG